MTSWIPLLLTAILSSTTCHAELIIFSDIAIECEPGGVEIILNGTALEEVLPKLDSDDLRIGEGPWISQCKPDPDDTRYGRQDWKVFKFGYGDCHPEIDDLTDTTVRLVYTIIDERRSKGEDTPRGTAVSCIVPKDGLISAKISHHTNVYKYVGSSVGEYQFGMTVYKDPFMTSPVQDDEDIPLGTSLWVGIKMNSSDNAEMYVKDCWATPTPTHAEEQTEHIFIKNGIIGEDDETFSPVDDVITATTYGFSFDSFMFRGSGSRVYIKCNVRVCDQDFIDSYKHICTIPKYPEFKVITRESEELGSGSGSGFGLGSPNELEDRDITEMEEDEDEEDEDDKEGVDTRAIIEKEFPIFYLMHSFKVKHVERKRRSTGSYRIYPRHTMFSNLRSGITLGIIIASTAMISACAILLPLHLSGEKVRCLQVKAVKRTI